MITKLRTTITQPVVSPLWFVFLSVFMAVLIGGAVAWYTLVVVLDYRHVVFQ